MILSSRIYEVSRHIDGCYTLDCEISKDDFEKLIKFRDSVHPMDDIDVEICIKKVEG